MSSITGIGSSSSSDLIQMLQKLEGGLRVPFIIRGPGIKPGSVSQVRAIGWDLLPTLADLAGAAKNVPADVEGGSLRNVLTHGGTGTVMRQGKEFVVHFPHEDLGNGGSASAIWDGNYKLIHSYETAATRLYDLSQDLAEQHDLAANMPDKAAELDRRLSAYLKSVHAQMPTPRAGPASTAPAQAPRERNGSPRERRERTAGGQRQPSQDSACNNVPTRPLDVILSRPTHDSITLSVLAYSDLQGFVEYGTRSGQYSHKTPARSFKKGELVELLVKALMSNTRYYYRLESRSDKAADYVASPEYTFHTQRPPGESFTFTVTADSHLDSQTDCDLYAHTLANVLADNPDFHVDLGDTFMTDKHATREQAARQYLAQRYYFGTIGTSVPLYLVLGNHDGEAGRYNDSTADCLAA